MFLGSLEMHEGILQTDRFWPKRSFISLVEFFRYNLLFKFLLAVKRVQLELQQCWACQMQQKQCLTSDRDVIKWLLRTHMAFLVNNLQYYLQVGSWWHHVKEDIKQNRVNNSIQFS